MEKKDTTFVFTKHEIADMIVAQIGLTQKQIFYPFFIEQTNMRLPEEVMVDLQIIPKGSKNGEFPHNI